MSRRIPIPREIVVAASIKRDAAELRVWLVLERSQFYLRGSCFPVVFYIRRVFRSESSRYKLLDGFVVELVCMLLSELGHVGFDLGAQQ